MKNKSTYVIAASIVSIVATINVITVLRLNSMYDFTQISIDALSENNWGENDWGGENEENKDKNDHIWSQPKTIACDLQEGVWHTASIERICEFCSVPYSCTPVKCGDVF